MVSKKGVVEIQFNWVFILIAGSVILLFFVNLAMNYRSGAETQLASNILLELGSLASSSLQSGNTAQEIEFGGLELSVRCNSDNCGELGCDQEFDFAGRGLASPAWMDLEPIFSSRYLEGDHIITWSLPWQAPYKVTNFLYLTNPDHKFYFVYEEEDDDSFRLAGNIYNLFQQNRYVDAELISNEEMSEVRYRGEHYIKFIIFFEGDVNNPPEEILSSPFDVLFVIPDSSKIDFGAVKFSRVEDLDLVPDDDAEYSYVGMNMLVGAIYSHSYDDYRCNVRKTMLKFENMNQIIYERIKFLHENCGSDSDLFCSGCSNFYAQDNALDYVEKINESIDSDYDLVDVGNLYENLKNLEVLNSRALEQSCPRIY